MKLSRAKTAARVVAKLMLLIVVALMIVSSSLRSVSLCKNVSARVKYSQCCCCDSKVNITEGGDVQLVILKELQAKKKSGSKANLSVISVTFAVSLEEVTSNNNLSDFFFHLTQFVSLLL